MRLHLYTIAFAAVFALSPSIAQTPAPTLLPVEAFGSLPLASGPSLSPDGAHLALVQPYNGHPVAVIRTVDGSAPPFAIPYDEGFIVGVRWANNDHVLITINLNKEWDSKTVVPWYRTISVDIKSRAAALMFSNMNWVRSYNTSASSVTDIALDDPTHIYMSLWADVRGGMKLVLYRLDLNTGVAEDAMRGSTDTGEWIMDGHGHVVARIDQTEHPRTDHFRIHTDKDDWKEIEAIPVSDKVDYSGLNEDGTALVFEEINDKSGIAGLVTHSMADAKKADLFSDSKYDIDHALYDPWTGRVIGASVVADSARDVYFDPKMQALQQGLEAAFPGKTAHAVSWDVSRQRVIVSVHGPRFPTVYYLVDRTLHQAAPLARAYPDIQETDLGEMKPYAYVARDGLEIPAYLTLPPGKAAKNLPVVIMPHGGPKARDDLDFDWMAQFFANRGYAVLQPNFRGSTGYGLKFKEAGYGQWGLKMQDDVTDGVKKLIADGIADPKRICIVGASYGGYAALAGAAFTPDLYACAASWAGVSDIRQMLGTDLGKFNDDKDTIKYWSLYIGDRWKDFDRLFATSPSESADKIKCPILLMHGADDATVRIDQSEIMDRALRRAKKKVTFIVVPKETHYLRSASSRIRWLTEVEKFLKENIGN